MGNWQGCVDALIFLRMKNLFRLILLLCIFFQSCKNTKRYYEFNNRVQVLKAGSYNSEKRITIFP